MFTWIKQYMPKRLYWRAAFILLFPVIFLQLIVSVVIMKNWAELASDLEEKNRDGQPLA